MKNIFVSYDDLNTFDCNNNTVQTTIFRLEDATEDETQKLESLIDALGYECVCTDDIGEVSAIGHYTTEEINADINEYYGH